MKTQMLSPILFSMILTGACSHNEQVARTPPPPPPPPPVAAAKPQAPPPSAESAAPQAIARTAEGEPAVYFDFDVAVLRDDARPVLQALADKLKANPQAKARIEGNCDERGTAEYNLALGAHRAQAARKYLLSLGVRKAQIETTSWGSERPKDPGHDETAWTQNRRDDLVVKRQGAVSSR